MPFVLDVSAMMPWILEDEVSRIAAAALKQLSYDEAVVPTLWWFELRNALVVGERRGRTTPERTQFFLQSLLRFPIVVDRSPEERIVMDLAREHRLTVYDAAYLELAMRHGVALATLDGALAKAAQRQDVPLLD